MPPPRFLPAFRNPIASQSVLCCFNGDYKQSYLKKLHPRGGMEGSNGSSPNFWVWLSLARGSTVCLSDALPFRFGKERASSTAQLTSARFGRMMWGGYSILFYSKRGRSRSRPLPFMMIPSSSSPPPTLPTFLSPPSLPLLRRQTLARKTFRGLDSHSERPYCHIFVLYYLETASDFYLLPSNFT